MLGSGIGLLMALAAVPVGTLRIVHAHFNLLGFMAFFIFGVAYHILPRFHGRLLYSENMAWVHFYLANFGLVGMALSFVIRDPLLTEGLLGTAEAASGTAAVTLPLAGVVSVAGILLFVLNIWKSMAPLKPTPPQG